MNSIERRLERLCNALPVRAVHPGPAIDPVVQPMLPSLPPPPITDWFVDEHGCRSRIVGPA